MDQEVSKFTSYFFMKVGPGNCLLDYSEKNQQENDGSTLLWVGYNGNPIPGVSGKHLAQESDQKDLDYLALASSSAYRGSSRVISYSDKYMYVWEIVGSLRKIGDQESGDLAKYCDGKTDVFRAFGLKKEDQIILKLQSELQGSSSTHGCKALPVKLIRKIERIHLPACIDSLSVNSYLNRGTFRYLFSTNRGLDPMLSLDFLKAGEIPIRLQASEPNWHESEFACFIRKYLDWHLDDSKPESFQRTYGLEDVEAKMLAISFMSPGQLETAASLLVLSLGMTLDVGIGKGLEHFN